VFPQPALEPGSGHHDRQDKARSIRRLAWWRRRTGIEPADDAERRPPVLKAGAASHLVSLAIVTDPILAAQAIEPSLAVTARRHQSPDECSPTVPTTRPGCIRGTCHRRCREADYESADTRPRSPANIPALPSGWVGSASLPARRPGTRPQGQPPSSVRSFARVWALRTAKPRQQLFISTCTGLPPACSARIFGTHSASSAAV
jgi:hypothetical protein